MQSLKSAFGIVRALVPVLYCGGLIYYFLDTTGSVEQAKQNGLGPTLLGLGVVGALFCIPLLVKVVRMLLGLRLTSNERVRSNASARDSEGEFDADAVLTRYMARQSEEAASKPSATPPSHEPAPPNRPTFGRRT